MIKWDGHTHTEFCPHGSLDRTVDRIEKAIRLGFTHYSLTEHAPLPEESLSDPQLKDECGMTFEKTVAYFTFIKELKRIYGDKITIHSGLEVDFLSNNLEFTKDLVKRFHNDLDEWIFSIHFLEVNKKLVCLDYSPQAFKEQLVNFYGSVDEVHFAYWDCLRQLLAQDFSFFPPHRIAHLAVIRKFIVEFPLSTRIFESPDFYRPIMEKIKLKGYALDFNMAGLANSTCNEAYLTNPMLYWCKKYKIELVYGSDAHNIDSIGQYYEKAKPWL
jgi:histidinol-phosphatase (PHP family)